MCLLLPRNSSAQDCGDNYELFQPKACVSKEWPAVIVQTSGMAASNIYSNWSEEILSLHVCNYAFLTAENMMSQTLEGSFDNKE